MSKLYTQHDVPAPEYRVRTVVRYIVTRYCHPYTEEVEDEIGPVPGRVYTGSSEVIGEFQNEQYAYEVATAMAGKEPAATVSV